MAGRTAVLTLLPFSIAELKGAGLVTPESYEEWVHRGFLPRIYREGIRPQSAWRDYYQTFVERDIRLPPYFRNFGKRQTKSPKLYFTDPGLAAWLLEIDQPQLKRIAAESATHFILPNHCGCLAFKKDSKSGPAFDGP